MLYALHRVTEREFRASYTNVGLYKRIFYLLFILFDIKNITEPH